MNKSIPKIGAVIVAVTVFLFAVCMIVKFHFGSYLVCMFLPIGYIMMAAGFHHECCEEQRVAASIGLVFSAIYAVLIFLVYFAQTTSVRLEDLNEQAIRILDYQRGGLLFNYDLLGYLSLPTISGSLRSTTCGMRSGKASFAPTPKNCRIVFRWWTTRNSNRSKMWSSKKL